MARKSWMQRSVERKQAADAANLADPNGWRCWNCNHHTRNSESACSQCGKFDNEKPRGGELAIPTNAIIMNRPVVPPPHTPVDKSPHEPVEKPPFSGIGGHHKGFRGRTNEWYTPPSLIAALGAFDFDPCCPPDLPWRTATQIVSPPNDGLSTPWEGRAFLNPPYGPDAHAWMAKLAEHGDGIALLFARTDSRWFFEHVWRRASALLFLDGRLHFWGRQPDGTITEAANNSGGPSVLVAYDRDPAQPNKLALWNSGLKGAFVHGQVVI